jgi:hypothetical protein
MLFINTECIQQYNETGDTPNYLHDHNGDRAFRLKWNRTDAWRGYYEAVPVKKYGWKKIDYDGWVTGNYSDAPEEARQENVNAKLKKLARDYSKKGFDVEAVFVLTSNVFSTAFDVFVKKYNKISEVDEDGNCKKCGEQVCVCDQLSAAANN